MEVEQQPLEMIVSRRAAGCLGVKPARPVGPPQGFLQQWRVEAAQDCHAGEWFLVTNLVTLFTFLLPLDSIPHFPELVSVVRNRLRFALLAASPPLDWDFSQAVAVSGNPRAVVGSMNDMVLSLATPRPAGVPTTFRDMETYLNRTPYSAIGTKGRYEIPGDHWQERIDALSRKLSGLD